MVLEQNDKVGSYFDEISRSYSARYGSENPFHNYFFRERLRAATADFIFNDKAVLDVGAGTGALYDELKANPGVDYYACDISAKMLSQSSIPTDRAFVGKVTDIHFPKDRFDYIFLLGVTTYQTPSELNDTLQFIQNHLTHDGKAILSFTSRSSLDHALRGTLRIARPFISRGVLAQSFATYAYRPRDIAEMAGDHGLHLTKTVYLNQTFTPFNTLWPRPSVALAKWLNQKCPAFSLPLLSADFLLFMEARSPE